MRAPIIAFIAATLLTVATGVIAQSSGFPSRPTFQQVTIGTGGAVLTNSSTELLVNGAALAPAPILCTTACNATAIVRGQSAIIRKGSTTSRASTTALTFDPDLQFTLPTGVGYHVEWCISFTHSGAAAAGLRYEWGQSAVGSGFGVYPSIGRMNSTLYTSADIADVSTNVATLGTGDYICGNGQATPNNATWGFMWAQNVSTAANTTVLGNNSQTYLKITRL